MLLIDETPKMSVRSKFILDNVKIGNLKGKIGIIKST